MEQLRACEAARLAAFKAVLGDFLQSGQAYIYIYIEYSVHIEYSVLGDFLQSGQAATHLHALVCGSVCLDVCVDVYAYRRMDGWFYG